MSRIWHIFHWQPQTLRATTDDDTTYDDCSGDTMAAVVALPFTTTHATLSCIRFTTGMTLDVVVLDDVVDDTDIVNDLPFPITTAHNIPCYTIGPQQTFTAFADIVRRLVGASHASQLVAPPPDKLPDKLLLLCPDNNGTGIVFKATQQTADQLHHPFFSSFVTVHSLVDVPGTATDVVDAWIAFYESNNPGCGAQFETIDIAATMVEKVLNRAQRVATIRPRAAIPAKRLHEEIAVFREHTAITLTGTVATDATVATWRALKLNAAEERVLRSMVSGSDHVKKQLADTRTGQLLLMRWFLHQRLWFNNTPEERATRASDLTTEFNTWLAATGVPLVLTEIGTLLRTLGLTSKRSSNGVHWPTTASQLDITRHIVGTEILLETDVEAPVASMFSAL